MEYNDFPILDDAQYKLMRDEFGKNFDFDRKACAFEIYLVISECNRACPLLFGKVNKEICAGLTACKQELKHAISNLEATFNLHASNEAIKDINLFAFLSRLTKALKQINLWQQKEQKEYFRHFAVQLSANVIAALNSVLLPMEKSNIQMFKYL